MEREVLYGHGGILSLREVVREHSEAIEFDLIGMGLRLRDAGSLRFNWRDLWVVCRNLGRDSALYRAMNPDDDTSWSITDYLLAMVVDNSAARLWQAGGGKGRRPKPLPRPSDSKKFKGDSLPAADMAEWLGWDGVEAPPVEVVFSPADRAQAIKGDLASGVRRADIAAAFGVSLSTVSRIARGESWGHIPV